MKRLLLAIGCLFLLQLSEAKPRHAFPKTPDEVGQNDRDLDDQINSISISTNLAAGDTDYVQINPTAPQTGSLSVTSGTYSGRVGVPNGTAAAPPLYFTGDTGHNTGFYNDVNDRIWVVTGGIARWQFIGESLGVLGGGYTSQILNASGTAVAPSYTFNVSGQTGNGMYSSPSALNFAVDGVQAGFFTNNGSGNYGLRLDDGIAGDPALTFINDTNTGLFLNGAGALSVTVDGATKVTWGASAYNPAGAGSISSGDAGSYWNDISYKTLSDRGCLGWFDDGVKMRDGKIVNDLEVFSLIKKHPTKKTIYGSPMLDYGTFPEVAYKKAEIDGNILPRDKDDEPFYWEIVDSSGTVLQRLYDDKKPHKDAIKKPAADAIEMTSMFSIMIGALKEANERIKNLEARVAALEKKKEKNGK